MSFTFFNEFILTDINHSKAVLILNELLKVLVLVYLVFVCMEKEGKPTALSQTLVSYGHQASVDSHHIESSFTIIFHSHVFCTLFPRADSVTIRRVTDNCIEFHAGSYV